MAKKQKYYVVWEGNETGIFTSWEECQKHIKGHAAAKYKAFDTKEEAEYALKRNYFEFVRKDKVTPSAKQKRISSTAIIGDSIAVDAACSGNPGIMEYRCVETTSGRLIFHKGPYKDGTNNIGEFLALVHALALLKKHANDHTAIYTDSVTAMSWVRNKKVKSNLEQTQHNAELFEMVERAVIWLKNNKYSNPIIKWETDSWGEIPADFGRK